MSEAISYEILGAGDRWTLTRNGEAGAEYATAEAAFEVAAARASIEMRSKNEIMIHIHAPPSDELHVPAASTIRQTSPQGSEPTNGVSIARD